MIRRAARGPTLPPVSEPAAERVGLFGGTWLLSCLLMFGVAVRYSAPDREVPSNRNERLVGVVMCLIGVALLEADRRQLRLGNRRGDDR